MTKLPNILLIYTGGTIGMVKDYKTGSLKAFNFNKLLEHIPEVHHLKCLIESTTFDVPIDSSNMDPDNWVVLAEIIEKNYDKFDGFVVLHGSDTMSYTASAISFMFENLSKPIIFTGSQLPIGDLRTDAKENLITSIEIASANTNGVPVVSEVCLYFEYKLYRANRTTKMNAEHFQAFMSYNYPTLCESGVHLKFFKQYLQKNPIDKKLKVIKNLNKNILILKIFPGIQKSTVESILNINGLKGVILETYGSGNAPSTDWFLNLLQEAINKGIHIINVTQCAGGSVIMGRYETSVALESIGIISGYDITTESALAKLMYLLGMNIPKNEFKSIFETSLRGELTQVL
ncbi:type I asparaginase [Lutibacter sp. HS1-25]|uniref:asparaginase n=1 Tax=Lutibacter sp. HS1-25 TaxID=2485000 RepID=UPI001013B7D2|nr:type I asparaginase [Lutibacter sp. HS1-25]RXP44479.1 type I asparaginase [Lutibacter sp. HS1-25]